MSVKKDVDWDAVRREKQAGTPAPELAKKYGVHVSSIYGHTKNGNGHAGAGKMRMGRAARNGAIGINGYAEMLRDLKAKRADIDAAIEAIGRLAV